MAAKDHFRKLTAVCAVVVLSLGLPDTASAWEPTDPVELVVPNGPGGANDLTARAMEAAIRENKLLQQPVVVVNKPGGGGSISRVYLNRFPGQGNLLAIAPQNLISNHIIGQGNDMWRDYTAIAVLYGEFIGIGVAANSSISSMDDLAERLLKDPQSLSIAIATSIGNQNHIAIAQSLKAKGVDIRNLKLVIFSSIADASTAVLGGHVDVLPAPAAFLGQRIESGQFKVLSVSAPERMGGALADVPTWKEAGIDSSFSFWRGLVGPADMTAEQIAFWDSTLKKMSETAEWKDYLAKNALDEQLMTSSETAVFFDQQDKAIRSTLEELALAK